MKRALVPLALTAGVLALFSIPGAALPRSPWLSADKLVHVLLFAALGWMWLRAFPDRARVILLGGIAFAVGTEVWQELLPIGRSGDPADAVADSLGLCLAIGVWTLKARRLASG